MKFRPKKNTNNALTIVRNYSNKIVWEPHNYTMRSYHKFSICERTMTRSLMRPMYGSTGIWVNGCDLSCWRMHVNFDIRRCMKFKIGDSCLLRITIFKRLDENIGCVDYNWKSMPNLPINSIYANTSSPLAIATSLFCDNGLNKKFLVLKDTKLFMNSSQLNNLHCARKRRNGFVESNEGINTAFKEGEIFCCVTVAPYDSELKMIDLKINLKLVFGPTYESDHSDARFELRY